MAARRGSVLNFSGFCVEEEEGLLPLELVLLSTRIKLSASEEVVGEAISLNIEQWCEGP